MVFEKRLPVTAADWKTNVQDKLQKFSDVCQAQAEADSELQPKNTTSSPACSNTFVEPTPTVKDQQFTKNATFPFH